MMAGRIQRVRAKSFEQIDEVLDACKSLAEGERVVLTVYMTLDPPRNKPCPFCESGRKWKLCPCHLEDKFTMTFYPKGYRRPERPSRMSHAAIGHIVGAWLGKLQLR